MNQQDPLLHNSLPSGLQATARPLSEILQPIDVDMTQKSQLDMAGVDSIVNAIAAGHTIFSLCEHLGVSVKSYLHWMTSLSPEERQLLDGARVAFYENLERLCQDKMVTIAKFSQNIDENDPEMIERLAIRDKALQTVERVLKSTQVTIARQLARDARQPDTSSEVHITQMIVSNEWLAALPDE